MGRLERAATRRSGASFRSLDRRYIWREAVQQAEPKSEIMISPDEIERVETELDGYVLERR